MNGNTLHHSRWKHLHGMHVNACPGVVLHSSPEKQSPSVYTWKVEMIKYDRLNVGCEKMKGVKDNIKCFGLKSGKDMAVINIGKTEGGAEMWRKKNLSFDVLCLLLDK